MPKAMMARVMMLLEEDEEEEDMMMVVDIVVSEIMVYISSEDCLFMSSAFDGNLSKCPPTFWKRHSVTTSPKIAPFTIDVAKKNKQGYIAPRATSFFTRAQRRLLALQRSIPSVRRGCRKDKKSHPKCFT